MPIQNLYLQINTYLYNFSYITFLFILLWSVLFHQKTIFSRQLISLALKIKESLLYLIQSIVLSILFIENLFPGMDIQGQEWLVDVD